MVFYGDLAKNPLAEEFCYNNVAERLPIEFFSWDVV